MIPGGFSFRFTSFSANVFNSSPDFTTHDSASLRAVPSAQNFHLAWLDANIDHPDEKDIQNSIQQLRSVANNVHQFSQADDFISFLNSVFNEKVLMVVSGSLGQSIVPRVHGLPQLTSIYVFCGDRVKHELWANKWAKVKGVFTEIGPIRDFLKQAIEQFLHDSIPMSFLPNSNTVQPEQLNQLDKTFMYTQILKDTLLEIPFEREMLRDFVNHCRREFSENPKELENINRFWEKYKSETPVWWYTCESFLYPMLNRALRMMEVETVISMGFFVGDLHRQIVKLHKKQFPRQKTSHPFVVYRGQGLPKVDFDHLKKSRGGLLSFNSFLSSTKKNSVALVYARRALNDSDLVGIIFEMLIDPQIPSTPYADVSKYSFFKGSEQEILFSMHTVFRIGDISLVDDPSNNVFRVHLVLTSDDDQQLTALTQRIQGELSASNGWYRLGHLLMQMDRLEKAEELYQALLGKARKDSEKGNIYHQLGWIQHRKGNYPAAIDLYQKALTMDSRVHSLHEPDVAVLFDNVGMVYRELGDYDTALMHHEKALEIYRSIFVPDNVHTATCLNCIGLVYYRKGQYDDALCVLQEALEIYRTMVSDNDPYLAAAYNNLGLVHDRLLDHSRALWYYEKCLEIHRRTLPSMHRDLAIPYQNIGKTLGYMGEYTRALGYHEKALYIFQRTLSANHPMMATCYFLIGTVYESMNQNSEALLHFDKALYIRTRVFPSHHPDVINLHSIMASLYEETGDYSKSLECFEKVLETNQRCLASNSPYLAVACFNVARVSSLLNDYRKAYDLAERAVTIGERSLPPNHPDLLRYRNMRETAQQML